MSERPEVATNVTEEAEAWADAAAAEAEASVASSDATFLAPSARLVRRLMVDAANELDIAIRHARDDRKALDERIKELEGRRGRLDRITELDDDLLERLVQELGAVVPGGRHVR